MLGNNLGTRLKDMSAYEQSPSSPEQIIRHQLSSMCNDALETKGTGEVLLGSLCFPISTRDGGEWGRARFIDGRCIDFTWVLPVSQRSARNVVTSYLLTDDLHTISAIKKESDRVTDCKQEIDTTFASDLCDFISASIQTSCYESISYEGTDFLEQIITPLNNSSKTSRNLADIVLLRVIELQNRIHKSR